MLPQAERATGPVAGEGLLHPVALGAVIVLLLNDHWGKYAFPGAFTGKLSDFAGLAFFPLFLQAGWEVGRSVLGLRWEPSRRVLGVAMLATALVFALVKLDTPITEVYRFGLGLLQWPARAIWAAVRGFGTPGLAPVSVVTDATDLVALPAVLLGAWTARSR